MGRQAADFYLSTGRMPLADPSDEPVRTKPAYTAARAARARRLHRLARRPGRARRSTPAQGSLAEGQDLFASHCAGCHQIEAQGGVVPDSVAPALQEATPAQIAEAVRVGPYLMPRFCERQISRHELDSITRYVLSTHDPPDRGGWGIGNIGPIPEGMVAWLLAGAALLIVARLLGERRPT